MNIFRHVFVTNLQKLKEKTMENRRKRGNEREIKEGSQ